MHVTSVLMWPCEKTYCMVSKPHLDLGDIHVHVHVCGTFVDRPVSVKIKTVKKLTKMTSLCAYVDAKLYPCERDGSLQSVCPLNGHCREESACYYS